MPGRPAASILVLCAALAAPAGAQESAPGTIARTVHDSIAGGASSGTPPGQPVPRGQVVARWGSGDEETHSAPTDNSGRYILCGLPGDRPISVHGRFVGVEGRDRRVSITGTLATGDVEVDLAAPATVRGRVRSLDTGDPVEAASVRLSGVHRTVLTDREGRFDLGAVGPGRHLLEVEHIAFGVRRDSVDVEAIETYDSPATVPPRFRTVDAACGVIVVWTRLGGPR